MTICTSFESHAVASAPAGTPPPSKVNFCHHRQKSPCIITFKSQSMSTVATTFTSESMSTLVTTFKSQSISTLVITFKCDLFSTFVTILLPKSQSVSTDGILLCQGRTAFLREMRLEEEAPWLPLYEKDVSRTFVSEDL